MQAVQQRPQLGEIRVVGLPVADVDDEPPELRNLIGDLGVRPAHRGGRVGPPEQPVQRGVQGGFLRVLVWPDFADQQPVDALDASHRTRVGQQVRGDPELVDVGSDRPVLDAEPFGEDGIGAGQPDFGRDRRQCTERVEDHRDVDCLLEQRTPDRRQQAGRGDAHGGQRHAHAGQHALRRDPPRPAGQHRYLAEPAELIDGQHRVGRL